MSASTSPQAVLTPPPPPDPMEDPVNREKVELAKAFTSHLLKGIKQIGMYRHNEAKFPEFLQKAHEAVGQYTTTYGPLSLKVDQQNLLLLGQPLFAEDTSLPYKFFRDGIRQLIFRADLTITEMVTFTLIALSEPERGHEDILAQLWKASMEHVEYVVVEGFKMDECSEEEVQVEVDQIVSFLYARLKTTSDDYLRFARLSTEDLDAQVDGVEQIRGAVIGGQTADDTLKAKLQKEIAEDENARLFPKLVSAVFQVVESGLEDAQLLEEIFIQLLDAMLLQEDFATINQILLKLRAMEQRSQDHGGIARLRQSFALKMGDEQRLMRLGEILKNGRAKQPQEIVRYLQALEAVTAPALLNVLEQIEVPENRQLLIDVLAQLAKEIPDPFVHRLDSDRPQTVRDMVAILEKSNHPERLKMFGGALRHKNLAIRLEVMNVIARGGSAEARKLIAECLNDSSVQIRITAIKLLPELDRDRAAVDLTRLVREEGFEKRTSEERAAIYGGLGASGTPNAITILTQVLQTRSTLLNKKRVLEDKLLAVHGLSSACTIQTFRLLQELVEDKGQPPELLAAARKAMYQTKKALFGEAAVQEEG